MGPTKAERIFALESTLKPKQFDPARAERFYRFVTEFVANRNNRGAKGLALAAFRPPPQFWSFARGEVPEDLEPIREVVVREITMLFDDERLEVIRELEIARLQIPRDRSGADEGGQGS